MCKNSTWIRTTEKVKEKTNKIEVYFQNGLFQFDLREHLIFCEKNKEIWNLLEGLKIWWGTRFCQINTSYTPNFTSTSLRLQKISFSLHFLRNLISEIFLANVFLGVCLLPPTVVSFFLYLRSPLSSIVKKTL